MPVKIDKKKEKHVIETQEGQHLNKLYDVKNTNEVKPGDPEE